MPTSVTPEQLLRIDALLRFLNVDQEAAKRRLFEKYGCREFTDMSEHQAVDLIGALDTAAQRVGEARV